LGGRGRRISEFKASLVYTESSRTASAIQRNPVSKKTKTKTKKQNKTKKQKQKKGRKERRKEGRKEGKKEGRKNRLGRDLHVLFNDYSLSLGLAFLYSIYEYYD
jgi:flagellar biosynthesis/type III secretory pathway protein FliH